MRIALLLIVLAAAVASWAGPGTHTEPIADLAFTPLAPRIDPPGDVVTFWSQIQDFSGSFQAYSSEEKTVTGYLCESADDFYSESGDTIVMVSWWGQERNLLPEGTAQIEEFIIRFCENDSTSFSTYNIPGAIIYEQHVFDFTAEYLGTIDKFYYSSDVPGGFAPTPGETYWLSIIAVHASTAANQQWYWFNCISEDYWGAEATIKSVHWGHPQWIPWSLWSNYVEHGFILYSRGDTPVEDKSWAQIKALFR